MRWSPPLPDRMTPAERAEAHRIEQQEAERKREMARKQIKSPTGIVRRQLDGTGAEEAINAAHRQVTEALKGVAESMERDRSLRQAEQAERDSDSRRQPRSLR